MDKDELAKRIDHCIDELIRLRIEATGRSVVPKRAQERLAKGICLYGGEKLEEKGTRGCCNTHWKAVMRLIKAGECTDLEAIRAGWILPAGTGGRSSENESVGDRLANNLVAEIAEQYGDEIDEPNHVTPVGKKRPALKKTSTTTKRKAAGG
jgi:hypothetical protein